MGCEARRMSLDIGDCDMNLSIRNIYIFMIHINSYTCVIVLRYMFDKD